jgi:hypothetical protein
MPILEPKKWFILIFCKKIKINHLLFSANPCSAFWKTVKLLFEHYLLRGGKIE